MGIALLSLAIMIAAIYLLAIVTDEFFVVSLDRISARLRLPHDVAGASLLAMGSSAPELAIALLALFRDGGAHSDLGIGTIVGSAIFNILVITGASAVARPAKITWRVVVRDTAMYMASIGLLIYTCMDGTVTLLETLAFLILYAVYLLILFNWKAISPEKARPALEPPVADNTTSTSEVNIFQRVTEIISQAIGFLMGNPEKSYLRAFGVSVALIAIISWYLVEYAIVFAEALSIPPVIVALTILAGGTSVPDMIASIVVARQGRGDMAIANAIGSNIFDILIGLGLPWLIVLGIRGDVVHFGTDGLLTSTVVLFGTVILLFVFLMTECLLSRREGWGLLGAYGVYLGWTWIIG